MRSSKHTLNKPRLADVIGSTSWNSEGSHGALHPNTLSSLVGLAAQLVSICQPESFVSGFSHENS